MRICFVGVGSIARRHIKNLREICQSRETELIIDAFRKNNQDSLEELGVDNIILNEGQLEDYYDAIFITNPTKYHMESLKQLHHRSKNFFIEKPLCSIDKIEEVKDLVCKEGITYYIACPLRYTDVIQYIKNNINPAEVKGVRCICSSYLPDWRPGTDYRNTYSAHKELGGGVSIDLIHEWDYIKYLFGMPEEVYYASGKLSNLEVNCEDYATYIAKYSDKILELHLDYFGRKTIREIMLFTDNDTIVGDLTNSKITYLSSDKTIQFREKRDDFQKKELLYFLDLMNGAMENDNNLDDAYHTLNLTQGKID